MKLNFKVRFKNPVFLTQLVLAILTPLLAYAGLTMQELTTWNALGSLLSEAIRNPYVLGLVLVSLWNAVNDPTTSGLSDSSGALTYTKPTE